MDLTLIALFLIVDTHTATLGTEVGVVVHAKEHIKNDIAPRYGTEEAAHKGSFVISQLALCDQPYGPVAGQTGRKSGTERREGYAAAVAGRPPRACQHAGP